MIDDNRGVNESGECNSGVGLEETPGGLGARDGGGPLEFSRFSRGEQLKKLLCQMANEMGGVEEINKTLLDSPWMKPVFEMIKEGENQKNIGDSTLVVDLAGYSRLCLTLPPSILMMVMERFHVAMYEVAKEYGGQIVREPLGDATVYAFNGMDFAEAAAHKMQNVMKTFIDDQMRKNLRQNGYRTEAFLINVGIAQGPITLKFSKMGDKRNVIFICGEAYEKIGRILKAEQKRGVVVGEEGIIEKGQNPAILPLPKELEPLEVCGVIHLAVELLKTTSIGDPRNLEEKNPSISREYTNIGAIRIDNSDGENILSKPQDPNHYKVMEILNKFCQRYPEIEVCKAGDGGELILTARDSVKLLDMIYKSFDAIKEISGVVPKAGIFEGVFYSENLYPKLSKTWKDLHSPAFASAVRTVNLPQVSGIYIQKEIRRTMKGIETQEDDFEFHNMGRVSLVKVNKLTEDFGKIQFPMVGRDNELQAVENFFDSQKPVFLFKGEAGSGKEWILKRIENKIKHERGEGEGEGKDFLVTYVDVKDLKEVLESILGQLFLQSNAFQWLQNERVYKEKIEEFMNSPSEFASFIVTSKLSLKLIIPKMHQMTITTLDFLSDLVSNLKSENLQIVGGFTENEYSLETLRNFSKAVDKAYLVEDLDSDAVIDFIEFKIDTPLIPYEKQALLDAGIQKPEVFEYFFPFFIKGGKDDLMAKLGEKNRVFQKIVDSLLEEKYVTPEERKILTVLSLFDEPLEFDLLVDFSSKTGGNLEKILYSLIKKGLVERREGKKYFLLKFFLLSSLQDEKISEVDELRRKAGLFFQKKANEVKGADLEKILLTEKATRYFMSIENKRDEDISNLEEILLKIKQIADMQGLPEIVLKFIRMRRIIVKEKYEKAYNDDDEYVENHKKALINLALEEAEIAYSLGKPEEAEEPYKIVISLFDIYSLSQKMRILRGYDRVLRMLGYGDENKVKIQGNIEKLRQIETKGFEEEEEYKEILIKITEMVDRVTVMEREKSYEEKKQEMEELYTSILEIYDKKSEKLYSRDLYDLVRMMTSIVVNMISILQKDKNKEEDILGRIQGIIQKVGEVIKKLEEEGETRYNLAIKTGLLRLPMVLFHRMVQKQEKSESESESGKNTYIEEFEKAVRNLLLHSIDVKDLGAEGRAWNYLGEASFFQENFKEAEARYKNALEKCPGEIHVRLPATINLSRTYFKMGKYDEAFWQARRAFQLLTYHRQVEGYKGFYQEHIEGAYNKAAEKIGENCLGL